MSGQTRQQQAPEHLLAVRCPMCVSSLNLILLPSQRDRHSWRQSWNSDRSSEPVLFMPCHLVHTYNMTE